MRTFQSEQLRRDSITSPDSFAAEEEDRIRQAVRQRLLERCPYASYFGDIQVFYDDGTLTLRGRLPSFYLKQILQTFLAQIDGVDSIRNEVAVISSNGLSSEPARPDGAQDI